MLSVSRAALLRAPVRAASTFAPFPNTLPEDFIPYTLEKKWTISPDSKVLRFQLPEDVLKEYKQELWNTYRWCSTCLPEGPLSILKAPAGVKVKAEIGGAAVEKSYSPVSMVWEDKYMDLLVKEYKPVSGGGGLGKYLCDMELGTKIDMKLKAPRNLAGYPYHPNRFKDVVLIGCGTGIAPLYQMAHMILANRDEKTKVWMVAAHRTEADILLREEFEQMAAFSDRFKLHVALSQPADPEGWNTESTSKSKPWTGSVGRLDLETLRATLPPGDKPSTMTVVCGLDGFLETICGPHVRIQIPGKSTLKKTQGPVVGFLGELGFGTGGRRGSEVVKL